LSLFESESHGMTLLGTEPLTHARPRFVAG
jgi:hypothetical protein